MQMKPMTLPMDSAPLSRHDPQEQGQNGQCSNGGECGSDQAEEVGPSRGQRRVEAGRQNRRQDRADELEDDAHQGQASDDREDAEKQSS